MLLEMFIVPVHFTFLENPEEKKLLIYSISSLFFLKFLAACFQIMAYLSLPLHHNWQFFFQTKNK